MSFLRYSAKNIIITLLSLLFSALIVAGCVYFFMFLRLPDVETLKEQRLQTPLRIYTNDGELIGEYGAMRRSLVPLSDIPKQLVNAVIATEDQRFFEHAGVDMIGVLRAVKELLITGQKNQGASTITMQVARNFFLTPEKTYTRKINEVLLALKINSAFSKEKILELYLNKIYLGQHAYGVASAASIYYGKELKDLNLAEIAMIAGLPQAPSKENPITNPTAAKIRRDHVLQRMLDLGYINQSEYSSAITVPIDTYYHGPKITVDAPHIAEMVRNVIHQQFGDDAYTTGLQVFTTLDSHLQTEANTALRDGLIGYEHRHVGYRGPEKNLGKMPKNLSVWQNALSNLPKVGDLIPAVVLSLNQGTAKLLLANGWTVHAAVPHRGLKIGDVTRLYQPNGKWEITQTPKVEGALVALDTSNGAILALNGGMSEADVGFNRATQAQRQPGSSFKPFIYAAALSQGYTLATIVEDAPLTINDTGDPNKFWSPQNDSGQFYGPMRLREGLVYSLNVMTVRLLQMVGVPYAVNYIAQFGFDRKSLPPYLSLALGTALETPIQMVQGYSVFSNGGYRVTPFFIKQIQSADGKVIYNANPATVPSAITVAGTPMAPRAIDADIAYLVTDALKDVIRRGTGYAATSLKRQDIAGKTGTTNRKVDAWFSGYTPHLATTVWVGYDQQTKSLSEHGSGAALPIWIDFMRAALQGKPQDDFKQPDNVVRVRIDPASGQIADPNQEDAFFEVFSTQNAPIEMPNTETEATVTTPTDPTVVENADPEVNAGADAELF
jgi:penicillin-binding protein 1A